MRKKYGDDLLIVTVSLDIAYFPDDPKAVREKKAAKVLNDFGVNMTNLILDETQETVEEKLRFGAPPCVFVFNRQGKWRQLTGADGNVTPEIINGLVEKFLREK